MAFLGTEISVTVKEKENCGPHSESSSECHSCKFFTGNKHLSIVFETFWNILYLNSIYYFETCLFLDVELKPNERKVIVGNHHGLRRPKTRFFSNATCLTFVEYMKTWRPPPFVSFDYRQVSESYIIIIKNNSKGVSDLSGESKTGCGAKRDSFVYFGCWNLFFQDHSVC